MRVVSGRKIAFAVVTLVVLMAAATLAQGVAARSSVGSPVKQGASTGHTVSVQGHGESSVAPDMATITLGVQNHDSSAATALSANSAKMNDIIAAVKGQGVPDSHIQTSNLSIYFDSQHDYYVVNHDVTAKIDNTSRVGAVLDAGVGAGANTSWGVSFGLKDSSAARALVLKAAVTDARKRADSLATALGVNISGVGSVVESSASYQPLPLDRASVGAPSAAPTTVQPGQLSVTADISVVYTFG